MLKKNELILWLFIPLSMLAYFALKYGYERILFGPSAALELFFCFSPTIFAILFYLVYESFPITYLMDLLSGKTQDKK
jgi:hypothetical protein